MICLAHPEATPSPVLLVHGEPLPFLAQPGAVTCVPQTLPYSISMSKYRPSAPIQNEPGLPHAGILRTVSADLRQESIMALTQAGPGSDSNCDCSPISVLPQSPWHLPLPKLPHGKETWGWGADLTPPVPEESFGEKKQNLFSIQI